jgi:hypothetical protein
VGVQPPEAAREEQDLFHLDLGETYPARRKNHQEVDVGIYHQRTAKIKEVNHDIGFWEHHH